MNQRMIENATKMIAEEIPNLMKLIPAEELNRERDGTTMIVGGVFNHVSWGSFYLLSIFSGNHAWRGWHQ